MENEKTHRKGPHPVHKKYSPLSNDKVKEKREEVHKMNVQMDKFISEHFSSWHLTNLISEETERLNNIKKEIIEELKKEGKEGRERNERWNGMSSKNIHVHKYWEMYNEFNNERHKLIRATNTIHGNPNLDSEDKMKNKLAKLHLPNDLKSYESPKSPNQEETMKLPINYVLDWLRTTKTKAYEMLVRKILLTTKNEKSKGAYVENQEPRTEVEANLVKMYRARKSLKKVLRIDYRYKKKQSEADKKHQAGPRSPRHSDVHDFHTIPEKEESRFKLATRGFTSRKLTPFPTLY